MVHAKRLRDLEAARRLSGRKSWGDGEGPEVSEENRRVLAQVYDAADYLELSHFKAPGRRRRG